MLGRLMHARERWYARRDDNRLVRPFEWGASFIAEHANGDDPRQLFAHHTRDVLADSEDYFSLPPITDYRLDDQLLTWTSAVQTPSPENNIARARFFREQTIEGKPNRTNRAVVLLPQWNADSNSHLELCRILSRFGIAALRMTLPYHEARRPRELERADHLVSPNIGRTLQSMRQAVLDTRAAVHWLVEDGYTEIGIMGTSIGSCVAFLTMVHEPLIKAGVFNHVSGYVADVVWHGISTQHVRAGISDTLTLEELRTHWLPISPYAYINKLAETNARPMRFIAARYDLTFPAHLSRDVIQAVERAGHPLDVVWLPCGHYSLGERPWKYIDGWKIVTFLRRHV